MVTMKKPAGNAASFRMAVHELPGLTIAVLQNVGTVAKVPRDKLSPKRLTKEAPEYCVPHRAR